MYKTVTLPAGSLLYRTPEYPKESDKTEWFTQNPESSRVYSDTGRVSEFKTVRDLVLLDIWTPETWAWIYATFPDSKYDLDMYSGKGHHFVTEDDDTNDFVKLFYDPMPKPFEGGTIEPRTQSRDTVYMNAQSPMNYHVLQWRGLTWGPHPGEYKRYSSLGLDYTIVDLIKSALPTEIDGLYAPILPAPKHFIESSGIRKAFHEEVIVFPPVDRKVVMVKQGGRRRKTTRPRRSRFNKQVRLTRRNAVHFK